MPAGFDHWVALADSPRDTVNFYAVITPNKKWEFDPTVRYESSRFSGNDNTGTKLGSQFVMDMRMAYEWRQMELFLGINDLLAKRYDEEPGFRLPGRTVYVGHSPQAMGMSLRARRKIGISSICHCARRKCYVCWSHFPEAAIPLSCWRRRAERWVKKMSWPSRPSVLPWRNARRNPAEDLGRRACWMFIHRFLQTEEMSNPVVRSQSHSIAASLLQQDELFRKTGTPSREKETARCFGRRI